MILITFRKKFRKFFVRKRVVDDAGGKAFEISLAPAFGLLPLIRRDHDFRDVRLLEILLYEVFRLVEEVEDGHLAVVGGESAFRFPAEPPLVQDADLLGEKLDLFVVVSEMGVRLIQLFLQGKELILQGGDEDKERVTVKIVQLVFRNPNHQKTSSIR